MAKKVAAYRWGNGIGGVLLVVLGIYLAAYRVLSAAIGAGFVREPDSLVGRVVQVGSEALNALTIPMLLWLYANATLVPIIAISEGQISITAAEGERLSIARLVIAVLIALTVLGIVINLLRLVIGGRQLALGEQKPGRDRRTPHVTLVPRVVDRSGQPGDPAFEIRDVQSAHPIFPPGLPFHPVGATSGPVSRRPRNWCQNNSAPTPVSAAPVRNSPW